MKQLKTSIFLLLGIFYLGNVKAQTTITLQDALNYALNNSEVIRQARLDIDNAYEKVRENKAGIFPQISVSSSLTNNPIVQEFVLPAEAFGGEPGKFMSIKVGQTWNALSQVQLSQQIYNQQLFTGIKASRTSKEYYELAQEVSEENVIQQVAATFYQVLISQEQVKVANANLEQVEKLKEIIQGQYESGLTKKVDLDRIKVKISNFQTQKLTLQNDLSKQKNLLKSYMGMPVSEDIQLQSTPVEDWDIPQALLFKKDVDTKNLDSYKVMEKQGDLLSFQKEAEKAKAWPTLSLDANYNYNTQSNKFNLYSGNALNYDASAVKLNLSIPIFDGNARKAKVKQIEIQRLQLQSKMRDKNNELQMNLDNARNQLQNSLKKIHSQKGNKELAQEVFLSTQNNYKNGLASLTDLLDAENDLVSAKNSYHEALLNYKIAKLNLAKASGNIKSLLKK